MGGLTVRALGLSYLKSPSKALQFDFGDFLDIPMPRGLSSLDFGGREQPLWSLTRRSLFPKLKPSHSSRATTATGKIYNKQVFPFLDKLVSMDDIFDSSLNLEETHLKEGYAEGYKDGLVAGKEEAKQVGLRVGFEVGEEIGFYRGCVDVWNSVIRIDSERFSIRVRKNVKQMEELVEKYPLQDPENEQVQELMDGLRLKFRAICATLGVKLDYNGYPKSASDGKQIDF